MTTSNTYGLLDDSYSLEDYERDGEVIKEWLDNQPSVTTETLELQLATQFDEECPLYKRLAQLHVNNQEGDDGA